MIWKPELDELARREAFAREMGGVEKVKRQRDQGRLTVRERIDKMVDANSFHEIGALSGIGEYDEHGELKHLTPANCVFGRAKGVVLESRVEQGRGIVASLLVQLGTLRVGDAFVAGQHSGRVRAMYDERSHGVREAGPSTPVEVVGWSGTPAAGDLFNGRLERKQLAVGANINKIVNTEETNDLEAGARRPRSARSVRARDGRR